MLCLASNPINIGAAHTDARECCKILMESNAESIAAPAQDRMKLPPLFYKNLYRAARALHYDDTKDG